MIVDPTSQEAQPSHLQPEWRILVVDDHDAMRQALSDLIESREELTVCGAAASAEEAVALFETAGPDLVVADLSLPGMDGIELTRALRDRRPDLPVVVVSSHPPRRYAERALAAGVRAYLPKREAVTALVPTIFESLGLAACSL